MILMTTESGQHVGRARRHARSLAAPTAAPRRDAIGSWRPVPAVRVDRRTTGVVVLPTPGYAHNATTSTGNAGGFMGAHLMATKPPARHLVKRST
jgi:hypothetical protein